MVRRHALLSVSLVSLLLLPSVVTADDWPGWRGAARDGRSPATGLLRQWPTEGPPLAWRAQGLGSGYASLSVVGDTIYTMGDLDDGQYVLALAREDGAQRWKTRVGPRWEDEYLGARSTPTVDDGRVYALSTEGTLVCLEAETGKLVWQHSLPEAFGGRLMKAKGQWDWKFSESPLVDGSLVIVTPGSADAALVAFDKRTGATRWRTQLPDLGPAGADGAGYSSVVVSEGAGVRQYVQLLGRGVIGVEAETGRFLWGYNRVANEIANIATPLIDGDHVFVSTGYGTGAALLRLAKTETGVEATEVYFLPADTFQNHHGGMILDRGTVYTGTGHNKGFPIAIALDDGAVQWGPIRNEGRNSAAVTFADGHLYLRYQNGTMVLVEATAEAYREKGSFEIPDVDQFSWSHPVVLDGRLYLREQDNLWVYDVAGP